MKLRIFLEGKPYKDSDSGEIVHPRGPLWCEVTFIGDGTPGRVEILFDGDYWIETTKTLQRHRTKLLKELELGRSELLAGPTQCDGKTIVHASRTRKLYPWTPQHVGDVANQLGGFILEWIDHPTPSQEELDEIRGPEPDPGLGDRIEAAIEYQRKIREEYQRTGIPPADDPFMTYPSAEESPGRNRSASRGAKPRRVAKRTVVSRSPQVPCEDDSTKEAEE